MKAFEEWINKQDPAKLFWHGEKMAWQAALKWVLDRVQYANSDGSIIYDIKQELGPIPSPKPQSTLPQDQEPQSMQQ